MNTHDALHNNIVDILKAIKNKQNIKPVKNVVTPFGTTIIHSPDPNNPVVPGPNPSPPSPSPNPTPTPVPVVPDVPNPNPNSFKSNQYEEFKCKALQILNDRINDYYITENFSLTVTKNDILEKSNYNEFKLKAVQIMNKVAYDEAAKKAKAEADKAKAEADKAKADAEQAKTEADEAAKQAIAEAENKNKSAQEEINKLNYAEFKFKALEKMRDIQLAQDAMNHNYQTFVFKATEVLNNVATKIFTDKINENTNAITDAKQKRQQLEQDFAYKEFKHNAELVLIRSLTGDISKQLAEKQTIIETDNYTEFKLKAQMVLTQALLNNQQQKYMEQQQQGFYEQFKSKALNVLTSIVAQQSLYDEFKEKALNALKEISTNSKIQSLTNDKYYEEFKQKALASLTYSNPELGSTEWVSTM